MGETPQVSPEEIDLLHDEALVLNDELGKRRAIDKESPETNSAIVEEAIREREEVVGRALNNPEFKEHIKRFYKREFSVPGQTIFVDPKLEGADLAEVKLFLYYLELSDFIPATVERVNSILPESFERAAVGEVPPIFIHAYDTAKKFGNKSPGWVEVYFNRKNINLVPGRMDLEGSFTHELIHNLEPKGNGDFCEGLTTMYEDLALDKDPHAIFIDGAKYISGKSDHPLAQALENSQGQIKLDLRSLLNSKAYVEREDDREYSYAITADNYLLGASFLLWYRDNVDPEMQFTDGFRANRLRNLDTITGKLADFFPVKRVQRTVVVDRVERSRTGFESGLPEEYRYLFGENYHRLAIPDSNPEMQELTAQIAALDPKTEGDEAKLRQFLEDYRALYEKNWAESESDYNQFISEKMSQALQ